MTFTGIPLAALDFYEDLEADNSKSFWTAHKHVYDEQVKAPLRGAGRGAGEGLRRAQVLPALPRRPLQQGQDAVQDPSGHLVRRDLDVPAGLGRRAVRRLRLLAHRVARRSTGCAARVDDDVTGAALERAVAAVRRKGFDVGGDQLTRVPSGYAKDHPRADLLRYKTLTAQPRARLSRLAGHRRAKTEIVKAWQGDEPLVAWLDTHVGRD